MAQKSVSQSWREAGNDVYKSVTDGLAPTIREKRLGDSRNKYYRALETAQSENDKASAAKNYAMASWKLALLGEEMNKRYKDTLHNFMESLKHFDKAAITGRTTQSACWNENLQGKYGVILQEFIIYVKNNTTVDERIAALNRAQSMLDSLPDDACGILCLELLRSHFAESVRARERNDFKAALHQLQECHFPLEEAKRRVARDKELEIELNIIEEDIHLETCVVESMQACFVADELIRKALSEYEDLPVALVWDAVDWYGKSILLTREKEVELEAIAFSRLGHVYDSILKLKYRAKDCYHRCIELTVTMLPRSFEKEDWCTEAKTTLKRYQDESVQAQQEKKRAETEDTVSELKDEIEELKGKAKEDTGATLLEFIYKTHPPKNAKHTLEKDYKEATKKALKAALIHYHPDRQSEEKHGKKWKVLCEEICKVLTPKYEYYKELD